MVHCLTPFSVDWDNDGLDDIISGNSAGNICFIKNLGRRIMILYGQLPSILK